ncbi:MAG TPA: hypothetical protein VFC79_06935 [Tissierellaceae bacterium]|nr:hypothetical protein [Tissierellaceae bacterium]
MLENELQQKVKKDLEKSNIYVVNIHGGGWGSKGTPDLLCSIKGKFYALELKVGNNKPSNAQLIHEISIKRSGGEHRFIWDWNGYLDFKKEIGI